jgi:RimJ/RimL family protein N-acetyltransferase
LAGKEADGRRPVTELHLETDRLELRALTLGDFDELASMLADAQALTHWGRRSPRRSRGPGSNGTSGDTRWMGREAGVPDRLGPGCTA